MIENAVVTQVIHALAKDCAIVPQAGEPSLSPLIGEVPPNFGRLVEMFEMTDQNKQPNQGDRQQQQQQQQGGGRQQGEQERKDRRRQEQQEENPERRQQGEPDERPNQP